MDSEKMILFLLDIIIQHQPRGTLSRKTDGRKSSTGAHKNIRFLHPPFVSVHHQHRAEKTDARVSISTPKRVFIRAVGAVSIRENSVIG